MSRKRRQDGRHGRHTAPSLDARLKAAVAHHRAGRLGEAEALYRRVLQSAPDQVDALNLLGAVLHQTGRSALAVELIGRALALDPDYAAAANNLGQALEAQHRFEEAAACYRRALALAPDHAEAANNLGNALQAQGRAEESIAWYRRALALRPGYASAHYNLGNALKTGGRMEEALAAYRMALLHQPDFAEAQCNLGTALKEMDRLEEAVAAYRRAMEVRPDYAVAHSNLLFCLNFMPTLGRAEVAAEHRRFGRRYDRPVVPGSFDNDTDPERRLRIGYVSPDFRSHAIGFFFFRTVERHNRDAFEIFCYAEVTRPDETTGRLRRLADHWHSTVGLSDAEMAAQIRRDRIDILIDLAGHTAGNRLPVFGLKPAPVQVTWLGYLNTTGLANMDYFLSASLSPELQKHFTERLYLLGASGGTYVPPAYAPDPSPPPCLDRGAVTFGCFNNSNKIGSAVVDCWSRILRALPAARLLLKSPNFAAASFAAAMRTRFAGQGVDGSRLILEGASDHPTYLQRYDAIDIALDPFPYNGGTTSFETLWMGVPMLALQGDPVSQLGSFGAGLLNTLGLSDLVAASVEDYAAKAVALAADPARLTELRTTLRPRMILAGLTDADRLTRAVEAAFRSMWRTWCATQGGGGVPASGQKDGGPEASTPQAAGGAPPSP